MRCHQITTSGSKEEVGQQQEEDCPTGKYTYL